MDHGVHIFVEFFERFPDNQQYFPKFQGVPISKINVSVSNVLTSHQFIEYLPTHTQQFPAVRIHALNLISMFDKTISMFELEGGMEEIGKRVLSKSDAFL